MLYFGLQETHGYVVETEIFLKNDSVLFLAQTTVLFGVYIYSLFREKEEVKVEILKKKKKSSAAGFKPEQPVIYLRDAKIWFIWKNHWSRQHSC